MQCEIINGKMHVTAGTATEQWAVDQFFGSMHSYMNPQDYIVDATKLVSTETQDNKARSSEDDELDAIFGKPAELQFQQPAPPPAIPMPQPEKLPVPDTDN